MKTTYESTDAYLCRVAEMDQAELIQEIRTFHCRFPLDFSREWLERQSTERLRHILGAAELHAVAD